MQLTPNGIGNNIQGYEGNQALYITKVDVLNFYKSLKFFNTVQ